LLCESNKNVFGVRHTVLENKCDTRIKAAINLAARYGNDYNVTIAEGCLARGLEGEKPQEGREKGRNEDEEEENKMVIG